MSRIYFWATLGVIWLVLSPSFYGQSPDRKNLILSGSGVVAGENIRHPSGNIFNQILLTGQNLTLQAKPNQITRVSFMDVNEDIVQVEFSGTGTFTITLDPATFLPAALPPRYNQDIMYVTGKPSVVIEGADSNTFISIFTVGTINAVNQALFPEGQIYDAEADVTLVEVVNSTGFGGMQLSNTTFSGSTSKVGIDARGVPIAVRLTVGDIDASGDAVPYLLFGEGSFTVPASNAGLRITGGDLFQTNGASIVAISEADNLISQRNIKSDGSNMEVKRIRGTFDFIDQRSVIFAPESLNGKGYYCYFEDGDPPIYIYFEGYSYSTSGPIRYLVSFSLEGSFVSASVSGWFNSEIDSIDSNKIYVTAILKTVDVYVDRDIIFSGSIEELAFLAEEEDLISNPIHFEMNFHTLTSGTYISTERRGMFEQSDG